jgi:hypothetical protein
LNVQDALTLLQQRLDNLGFDVGYRLLVVFIIIRILQLHGLKCRYIEKIAQHRPLVSDPLEVVKFVCKDFWEEVFKKKV